MVEGLLPGLEDRCIEVIVTLGIFNGETYLALLITKALF